MAKSQDEIIEAVAASEKLKALQAAMAKIEKDFGKGSIMKLGDEKVENVEVISTGSLALNAALGVGGYPKAASSKSTAPSRQAKPPSPSTPLPRRRRTEASQPSSTPSMPSTAFMRPNWV